MSRKRFTRRRRPIGGLPKAIINAPWQGYLIAGGVVFMLSISDPLAYALWAVALGKAIWRDSWTKRRKGSAAPARNDGLQKTRSQQLLRDGKAYVRTRSLMTDHEKRCYHHLKARLPAIAVELGYEPNQPSGQLRIHSKVRVVDVVQPNAQRYTEGTRNHTGLFRQISQWHFDFIICDDVTQKILIAMELDDSSHQLPDRVRRDNILDEVCRDAQMPFTRLLIERQQITYQPVYPNSSPVLRDLKTGEVKTETPTAA